ncbi:MAG: enoyl-CoA hydratase/isomerase family protein [Chloroflexi bacterium]|nr:enoyl-CoA hydratase/isomerase family protein [Chloroflexota bacterium]
MEHTTNGNPDGARRFQDLLYEKRDRIAYLTINRPHVLNAISPVTQDELNEVFEDIADDPDVWVVVLTGAGDRAFSAGADIKWRFEHPEENERREHERKKRRRRVYWHLDASYGGDLPLEVWKPIIAAVNGYALGGGFEVAMNCDIVIAAETAVFGLPEVTRGWTPAAANFLLPRHIPRKIAMEMLLFGDRISAQRAYEVGLVNKLVPAAELLDTATAYAQRLCQNPPLAVQAAKQLFLRGLDMPMNYAPVAWHLMSDAVTRAVQDSEDIAEGRRAFAEKRAPQFKGR